MAPKPIDGRLISRVLALRGEGKPQVAIAVECGVSQGTVSVILRRRGQGGRLVKAEEREKQDAFDELYSEWARAALSERLLRRKMIEMGEKRYLGYVRAKTEGEPDEGVDGLGD